MGPEKNHPLGKKLNKVDKRQRLVELRGEDEEGEKLTPNYEVIRAGSDIQLKLAERLNKALQSGEKFIQVGEAEPNEDQTEIVPETIVDQSFLDSLPKDREFVIYANAHDLSTTPDNIRPLLGKNVLIVFESDHRLYDELTYTLEPDAEEAA